jgi:undecaprenyl-diphosphatase
MLPWQALLLGIVQGITEFLPVSSSGHLTLIEHLFGFEHLQDYVFFNLVCHLGTLAAIFSIFLPRTKSPLMTQMVSVRSLMLGTLPLFPLTLILKPIKSIFNHPECLGPCFLISACLLFTGFYCRFPMSPQKPSRRWQDPLTIGLFQAAAVLPGISRSGATISAAYLLGWSQEQAIRFSFLLAIPAIMGGTILEGWQAWHSFRSPFTHASSFMVLVIGFLGSYFTGYLSIQWLLRSAAQKRWRYFAWYCLILGLTTTFYFHLLT